MFRGCFEHTVDDKGRLSIPAKYRDALETGFSAPLWITRKKECLVAYPSDEWRALEARMEEHSDFNPKVLAFRRYFYASAQECPLDKGGRVLLPPILRSHAALDREVVLVGLAKTFEIWDKGRYDIMIAAAEEDFDATAQAMGELGL